MLLRTAMPMARPLPNFLIIGAQKSGTTSLYKYLQGHPDIFMSFPMKEPGFFLGTRGAKILWAHQGIDVPSLHDLLDNHMLRGHRGEHLFGEASTYYTISERSVRWRVPQRIHRINPEMRFIYILREPWERIVSNYLHLRRTGRTTLCLADFLDHEEGKAALRTSMYAWQLENYLRHFRREQFCILIFEEFVRAPDREMRRVYLHLDLDPVVSTVRYRPFNVSNNRNTIDKEELSLDDERVSSLRERLRPDTERLFELLGRRVEVWEAPRSGEAGISVDHCSPMRSRGKSSGKPAP
jgi:hypothetical protein